VRPVSLPAGRAVMISMFQIAVKVTPPPARLIGTARAALYGHSGSVGDARLPFREVGATIPARPRLTSDSCPHADASPISSPRPAATRDLPIAHRGQRLPCARGLDDRHRPLYRLLAPDRLPPRHRIGRGVAAGPEPHEAVSGRELDEPCHPAGNLFRRS